MKKNVLHIPTIIFIFFTFTACSVKNDLFTKQIDRNGVDLVIMEGGGSVTYLKDSNTLEKFCASREIDSVKTVGEGVGIGVNSGTIGENISASESSGALALGGRSPAVLITREMLFRACELTMNLNLNSEQTIDVYRMFLDYTNKFIRNEHDQGSSPAISPLNNSITSQKNTIKEEIIDEEEEEDKENEY